MRFGGGAHVGGRQSTVDGEWSVASGQWPENAGAGARADFVGAGDFRGDSAVGGTREKAGAVGGRAVGKHDGMGGIGICNLKFVTLVHVVAVNERAAQAGVEPGMTRLQAEERMKAAVASHQSPGKSAAGEGAPRGEQFFIHSRWRLSRAGLTGKGSQRGAGLEIRDVMPPGDGP